MFRRTLASNCLSYLPFEASVKEACLFAMLRIAAECEDITNDIKEKVNKMSEVSGRHLRRVGL
jgi:hypothetical protein